MNPVVSKEKKDGILTYTVKKLLTDEETEASLRKFFVEKDFPLILREDADVFSEEGKLLLRFRKHVLSQKSLDKAYEGLKEVIKGKSRDRGVASGSKPGLETGEKSRLCRILLDTLINGRLGKREHLRIPISKNQAIVGSPASIRTIQKDFNKRYPLSKKSTNNTNNCAPKNIQVREKQPDRLRFISRALPFPQLRQISTFVLRHTRTQVTGRQDSAI